jgi:uncharacterized protein YrrD
MTKIKNTYKENISEIHGNLVVSYEEGDRLGNVGDVYFDKQTCGIKGISLASKLLEPEEKNFIKFKDIMKLGNSVVIISKKSALVTLPKGLEGHGLRFLKSIRIVTQDGENLGEMADVNVIAESGIIQEIILWGDKKIQIDVAKDEIQIGPDMIVVPSAYKSRITKHVKQHEDTFSNVVKNAGKVTRRFADSITDSINEAVHKVSSASKAEASEVKSTSAAPKDSPVKKKANKAPAKKATAKKAPAKKANAKKKTARKAPAKKKVVKKATAKK